MPQEVAWLVERVTIPGDGAPTSLRLYLLSTSNSRRTASSLTPGIASATPEDVFALRHPLRSLYTALESHGDVFAALSPSTSVQAATGSSPRKLLDQVWAKYGAGAEPGRKAAGDGEPGPSGTGRSEGRVRRLVDGQGKVSVS